jgi:hypothetical protein
MTIVQTAFIASILTASFAPIDVNAHNACDVDLTAGISINHNTIEFFKAKASKNEDSRNLYKITQGKYLFIDKQSIELSQSQQALISEYDARIRQLVPQVKNVAIEGVDLAIDGIGLAFIGLLGEGNNVSADLTRELEEIREQVTTKLSIEEGVTLGIDGFEGEDLFGKDFEQRIEKLVEKTVLNSMGTMLMAMGKQMISADDKEESFETRMEKFADSIEQEMSVRADTIKAQAQGLCRSIVKVDSLEEQLKDNIKSLSHIDVFTVTYGQYDDKKHALSM